MVIGARVGGYVTWDSVGVGRVVSIAVTSAVGLKVGGNVSGPGSCGGGVTWVVGLFVGFSVTGFVVGLFVGLGVTGF